MLERERLEKIISILRTRKTMINSELCELLFCSPSTLRRDLLKLEKDGLIKKSHGSTSLISSTNNEFSSFFRETERTAEKEYICNLANDFITDGQALFLDSSSTVNKLCPHIQDNNLIVVTNYLKNALDLNSADKIQTFIVGGEIKTNSACVVGEMTGSFLKQFNADIAFISCRGISLEGIYEADLNQALFKQHMIKNAKKTILLCDISKFDSEHFFKLASYNQIDTIITNKKPPESYQKLLEEFDCEIIY